MQIVYCQTCGFRIAQQDVESGAAIIVEEGIAYCPKCAPTSAPPPPPVKSKQSSRLNIVPATSDGTEKRSSGRMRAAPRVTRRTPGGSPVKAESSRSIPAAVPSSEEPDPSVDAPVAKPRHPLGVLIAGGAVGVFALGAILFLLFRGGKSRPEVEPWSSGPGDSASLPDKPAPLPKSAAPVAPDAQKPAMPGLSMLGAVDVASNDKKTPVTPPVAPANTAPASEKPINGEIVWIDDELPAGAVPSGTLKENSWKWVDSPVLSGNRSHTSNLPPEHQMSQHYFDNASAPLKCGPADKLFTYVFIDSNIPPKEIMMQFSYQKSWEHRVYWGEDLLHYNPAILPLSKGPLPDKGRWVRLEVTGAEIGIAGYEMIDGWSFDDFGGIVYWDKAGVVPGPPPAPVAVAAPVAPTVAPGTSLAKLMWNQLQGGTEYPNKKAFGKESRAIWGKLTPTHTISGTFNVVAGALGAANISMWSLQDVATVHIAVTVNNQEVFNGTLPNGKLWTEQHLGIPDGLLKAGANDFRIDNLEESAKMNATWIMIHSFEILSGPSAAAVAAAPAPPLAPLGVSLAKISLKEIGGGTSHDNFLGKGKTGRAIWGKKHGMTTATAPFDIKFGAGPATLVVDAFPHVRPATCQISISVNGKEIFKGAAPASPGNQWSDQRFDIPDGVLKVGKNDVRIEDLEAEAEPWYMLFAMEVFAARPLTPEETLVAGAPKKTLEDDGMLFNIDVVGRLQSKLKGKAAKNTVLFAGPGLNMKDFDLKTFGRHWAIKTPSKELSGPGASPAQLLLTLPAELDALKPEAVVLVADAVVMRKLSDIERQDWEDVARLCARMGAVPVLCITAAGAKEESTDLHNLLVRAANDNQLPAFQFKSAELFPVQVKQMLELVEKHVLGRDTASAEGKSSKEIE